MKAIRLFLILLMATVPGINVAMQDFHKFTQAIPQDSFIQGTTLLMNVLERGIYPPGKLAEFTEYLIAQRGQKADQRDLQGRSALWYAITNAVIFSWESHGRSGTIKYKRLDDAIPVLLKHIDLKSPHGIKMKREAISYALQAYHRHVNRFQQMPQEFPNKENNSMDARTATVTAYANVIQRLAHAGFSVNSHLDHWSAPLCFAIMRNFPRMVTTLLELGADTSVINIEEEEIFVWSRDYDSLKSEYKYGWYRAYNYRSYYEQIKQQRLVRKAHFEAMHQDKANYLALLPYDLIKITKPYIA
jgi:hypothetical protein